MRAKVSYIYILIAELALAAVLAIHGTCSYAQSLPQALNISGGLFNPNGTPITASSVAFKLEIMDRNSTCVLYSEEHLAQNLSQTKGAFSIQLGSGTSPSNALLGGTAFDYRLFLNTGVVAPFGACLGGVTLAAGDERMIRVYYNLGAGFIAMTPDVPIVSSAFAMVADTLRGKIPTDFVQTNGSSASLTQLNVENIFSNINYPKLNALLNGTSNQYLPTTPSAPVNFNGQRIVNVLDPTGAQDAATKNYADSNLGGKVIDSSGVALGVGGGKTLVWDQALNKWVAQTPATYVGGVVAGPGLLGGTITSFGTLSVDVGTNANQIVQLTNLSYLPALDAHLLTNIQFPVLSVAGRMGAVTLSAVDISGLGTAAVKDYGTASGNLVELAGASLLPALNGSLLTNVNATLLQSRAVANVAPTAGQILTWNNSASRWEPQNATIAGITDLTGDVTATGPGSAVATISANAVTSGKINNSGNVINRLLITDGTSGATVTYATCLQGEVMKYDVTTGWGCAVDVGASGVVTVVAAGTGMVAGTITSNGTLNVDVGTTANKILQLNASAQIPAVDGFLVANVNAAKLQNRNLASTAPSAGQVIGWTGSQWEPISVTSGTLTQIVAATGLLGGTINSNGTVSVDVGVTANKIVQLTAGAQYPAVDGNLISNVNAVKLQARSVAATAPGDGQVLTWNNAISVWEPKAPGAGADNLGNHIASQNLAMTNFSVTGLNLGTAGAPSLSFNSDATTGVYSPGASIVAVATAGAERLRVTANGMRLAPAALPGAPAAGDIAIDSGATNTLKYYNGSAWVSSSGTLTGVVSGTGLVAGTISSFGTVNVDVGVTANKVLQLDANAQIPAVDGFLVTNVNAVKLQNRNLASTAPTAGQVIGWTGSQWAPVSVTSGTLTQIIASTGLLGGTINSNGTVSVDVGVTANKIVQLTAGAQYPAVDGNLISNINAVKIQGRDVAASAPASNQVLTWTGSQWEPSSPQASANSFVNGGNAFGSTATLGTTDTTNLNIIAGNSVQMTVLAAGGVGIGTTNPTRKLQVVEINGNTSPVIFENSDATGASSDWPSLILRRSMSNSSTPGSFGTGINFELENNADGFYNVGGDIYVSWENSQPDSLNRHSKMSFSTARNGVIAERMRINSSGSVGIGTNTPTPGAILDLNGTGTIGSAMVVPRDTTALRPVAGVNGMIRYNTSTNRLEGFENGQWGNISAATNPVAAVGTAGAIQYSNGAGGFASNNNISIDGTNSRVGIGTTSPTDSLHVIGSANGSGAGHLLVQNTFNGSNAYGGLMALNSSGATTEFGMASVAYTMYTAIPGNSGFIRNVTNGGISLITNAQPIRFYSGDNSTNETMRISALGSVGIGTSSPSALLEVYGTTAGQLQPLNLINGIGAASGRGVRLGFQGNGNTNMANVAAVWEGASSADAALAFSTRGSAVIGEGMRITSTKMVGIGTTVPAAGAILDVNGTGTIGSAMIVPRDTTALRPTAGVNGMIRYNTSTSMLESFENGAWGNMSASSSNAFIQGGNSFLGNANIGVTDNYALNLITNNSARLTITALGNVGIGTTSPSSALEVNGVVKFANGSATAPSLTFSSEPTTGFSWNTAGQLNFNSGGATPYIFRASDMQSLTNGGFVMRATNGTAALPTYSFRGDTTTGIYDVGVGTMGFATAGVSRVVIDQLGNVGIGTLTPRVALDVNGAVASAPAVNVTGATVDFLRNNIAYTAQNCGNFDLWNMKDGATYTFAVQGTSSALCVFTAYSGSGAGALTVKMPPGHGVTTATFQTMYSFLVAGSTVYVSWIPGY